MSRTIRIFKFWIGGGNLSALDVVQCINIEFINNLNQHSNCKSISAVYLVSNRNNEMQIAKSLSFTADYWNKGSIE